MNQSSTVEDVHLDAGRMVVFVKNERHYELYNQRDGWRPIVAKITEEMTWERKGTEWRLVRETAYRAVAQVDPEWQKAVDELNIKAAEPPPCNRDASGRCR